MYFADVEGRSPLGKTLDGKLLLELNSQCEAAQDGRGEEGEGRLRLSLWPCHFPLRPLVKLHNRSLLIGFLVGEGVCPTGVE